MNPVMIVIAQFAACSALIVWSGTRLSRYGDIIAEKTGLGGTWVGLILMATITSLPELVTGVSSVVIYDVPDIAAGDAIGSCRLNLIILSLLDVRDAGVVQFEPEGASGTRVQIRLSYNPPVGAMGHAIAVLLGDDPRRKMDEDLARMKTLIEQAAS